MADPMGGHPEGDPSVNAGAYYDHSRSVPSSSAAAYNRASQGSITPFPLTASSPPPAAGPASPPAGAMPMGHYPQTSYSSMGGHQPTLVAPAPVVAHSGLPLGMPQQSFAGAPMAAMGSGSGHGHTPMGSLSGHGYGQPGAGTPPVAGYDSFGRPIIASPPPHHGLVSPPPHQGLSSPPPGFAGTSPRTGSPYAGRADSPAHSTLQVENGATGGLNRGKTSKSRSTGVSRLTGKSTATTGTMGSRKRERLLPNRWAGAWMLAIFLECAATITMACLAFGYIEARVDTQVQDLKTMSVYLALFIFGMVFHFIVALDAVRLKNTLQVIGVLIFNICLIVTAALSIPQIRDALADQDRAGLAVKCQADDPSAQCQAITSLYPIIKKFLIVVPIVLGVFQFILLGLSWPLYKEFSWSIYTNIGADITLRRRYLWYQVFVVFLKFSFFGGISFTVSYLILISARSDPQWTFGLTIAAVPIAALVLLIAAFAARQESDILMGISEFALIAGLTYFAYKLTRIYTPDSQAAYRFVRLSLTFISAFAIFVVLGTVITGFIVWSNFGKGLKTAHETIGMFSLVRSTRSAVHPMHNKGLSDVEETKMNGDGTTAAHADQNASIMSPGRRASRLSLD